MITEMTRRDTFKLGASAAAATGVSPLLSSSTTLQTETPHTSDEICFMRAVDIMAAIRGKKLSAREVTEAHLNQIKRVNPRVNAMVTLVPEDQLMAQAAKADEALAKGNWLGPL